MADKAIQGDNVEWSGHPTGVVSEIEETGQLEIESGATKEYKKASKENPVVHVAREGNGVVELEEVGEGSRKASGEESGKGLEGKSQAEAEVITQEGTEVEAGEKRQRPTETEEVMEVRAEEEGGKKVKKAKKGKKATDEKGEEEKPPKKERKAKTTAKAKIQAGETTTTPKKRGRPRKPSSSTKRDNGMDVVETAPVQSEEGKSH